MPKLSKVEFETRTKELVNKELKQEYGLWWLSFADKKFNGVIITRANGLLTALSNANMLGINPGGEVLGYPIQEHKSLSSHIDKLLDKPIALRLSKLVKPRGQDVT